ncbi:MAG: hypothetical protein SFZ24_03595 [Planctomycetota bacterium]|nr:hypothetical protein [Planctomycetota bacterium]
MTPERPTFHESWHRVAALRPRLRPSVRTIRQVFRGRVWHIAEDPTGARYTRLSESAYRFVALLDGRRSVADAWAIVTTQLGDDAPTQGEALQILAQLSSANLIASSDPGDAAAFLQRRRRRIALEARSTLMNALFARIPLWDPDAFLARWAPLVGLAFTRAGFIAWLALLAAGLYHLAGREQSLALEARSAIDSAHPAYLFAVFIALKLFHELGHGFACKCLGRREGGEAGAVHSIGLMLLVLVPAPYVDATSSWGLRRTRDRVIVGAAGMMVELACAAIAAVVWARTPQGTLLHDTAFHVMLIAGVSTVIFNINPLMRLDGYAILCDLLGTPNLASRSRDAVHSFIKRRIWHVRVPPPELSPFERFFFPLYWSAALAYRAVLCVGIALLIAQRQWILGVALIALLAALWLALPAATFFRYLFTSPELTRVRPRALISSALALTVAAFALAVIPAPQHVRLAGTVEPARYDRVFARAEGWIDRAAPAASFVDDILLEASNPDLEARRRVLAAERDAVLTARRVALAADPAEAQRLAGALAALQDQLDLAEESLANLTVRAPFPGTWLVRDEAIAKGAYLNRGSPLGIVADLSHLAVRASAGQETAARLIDAAARRARVAAPRAPSAAATLESITPAGGDPASRLTIISAWTAAHADPEPQAAPAAQAFDVRLLLDPGAPFAPGQSVIVRMALPDRPIGLQALDALRRAFQERFRL